MCIRDRKNKETKYVKIINNSDIDYELELVQPGIGFDAPEAVLLKAHRLTLLELNGNSDEVAGVKSLEVYYKVNNMVVGSEENIVVTFSFVNN